MRYFHLLRETFEFVMQNLFEITLVTIAWLLLQLPVITAPAATVGVFYFARQALLRDEAQFRDFSLGVRTFFWRSWLVVLPALLLVAVAAYDIAFFVAQDEPMIRLAASIPMAVLGFLLIVQNYALVFFVRERGALWMSITRAALLALSDPLFTFAVLLMTMLYLLVLYATKIGLALVFVGPMAVLQSKAVAHLLASRGVEF